MDHRSIFTLLVLAAFLPTNAFAQAPSVDCRKWRDIVMAVHFTLDEYYYHLDNRGIKNSKKKADRIASAFGLPNGEAPQHLFPDARSCRYRVPEKPPITNLAEPQEKPFLGYQCDIVIEEKKPVDTAGLEVRATKIQDTVLACSQEFKDMPALVASDRGIERKTAVKNDQTVVALDLWPSGSVEYPKSALSALKVVAGYRPMPMPDKTFLHLVVYQVIYERVRR
ncbi:hypothetical protein EOI86_03045 [Hwanghaeella grinnelliae]|uniref:TonB C-terminal domain-containing protein n=1 Tax=Hwanghaeella grinnelliae TaxID=2500179 RepID=A0A3S2WTR5_9PROT|nr:hypothetical protein [Hwanghaeella grinnelliae]RVU38285.1 hypothetical protein EOI86_03045 [Hwanghaeella grinnelliae]